MTQSIIHDISLLTGGQLNGDPDYAAITKQAGLNVPDSKSDDDHGDDSGSVDEEEEDEEVRVGVAQLLRGTQANHIEQSPPRGGKGGQQEQARVSNKSKQQTSHEQATASNKSKQQTSHEQATDEPQKKQEQATDKQQKAKSKPEPEPKPEQIPNPIVPNEPEPVKLNISERVKLGEVVLEDKPELEKARKVVSDKFTGSQAHNPNVRTAW